MFIYLTQNLTKNVWLRWAVRAVLLALVLVLMWSSFQAVYDVAPWLFTWEEIPLVFWVSALLFLYILAELVLASRKPVPKRRAS